MTESRGPDSNKMNREPAALRDAREQVARLERKLSAASKIVSQLEQQIAEINAKPYTQEGSRSLAAYESFRSKIRASIPRLLEERQTALQRIEELTGVGVARAVWEAHMRGVTQDALFAVARDVRKSGLDPMFVDRMRRVVGPDRVMQEEFAPLEGEDLRKLFLTDPTEDFFTRRVLDVPRPRGEARDYFWRLPLDRIDNVLEYCVDRRFDKCIRRLVANGVSKEVLDEIFMSNPNISPFRVVEALMSSGYTPSSEAVTGYLKTYLRFWGDQDHYAGDWGPVWRQDTITVIQVLSRFGSTLSLEQLQEVALRAWQLLNPINYPFFRYLRFKFRFILALYEHPLFQADLTQFPLWYNGDEIIYYASFVYDQIPRGPDGKRNVTWDDIVRLGLSTEEQITQARGQDIMFIQRPIRPLTAEEIRVYMSMLTVLFDRE